MKRHLIQAAVPLILFAATLYLARKPYYNWDMFPYMALAADNPSIPFSHTHAHIYQEASSRMTPADFNAISGRQSALRDDPEAFLKILKYFRIKPGYLMVVRLGHFLGLNLLVATYLPSIISYFLMGCLLFDWSRKSISLPAAALISLVIATSPFLLQTARYSSPDMLCALVLMSGLFLATEYLVGAGLLVAGFAILVRPDSFIFFVSVILAFHLAGRISRFQAIASAAAGALLTFFVVADPGLLQEFLVTDEDYSSTWSTSAMARHYFASVRNGIPSIWHSSAWVFASLAAVCVYFRLKHHDLWGDLWSLLTLLAVTAIAVRYVFHPVIEDRFLIPNYLVIIMGLCKTLPYYLIARPNRTLP